MFARIYFAVDRAPMTTLRPAEQLPDALQLVGEYCPTSGRSRRPASAAVMTSEPPACVITGE